MCIRDSYCPSIETKIVRFPDKPRHQLFIEPMGLDTEELYIQGFSSSMPEEVQIEMLHSVKGLEHAEMMRQMCIRDRFRPKQGMKMKLCSLKYAPNTAVAASVNEMRILFMTNIITCLLYTSRCV